MTDETPSRRLIGFVRYLRREGFNVGTQEGLDAVQAVVLAQPWEASLLRDALRPITCRDHEEWQRFDTLFERYWLRVPDGRSAAQSAAERIDPRLRADRQRRVAAVGLGHAVDMEKAPTDLDEGGAGRQGSIGRADFRFLTDRRASRILECLAERLAMRVRRRQTRRRRELSRGRRIHLRSTLRRSLQSGGTPLQLRYLARRREPVRLLFLHDVSHSMAGYGALLTRFVRGLMRAFPRSEAFVFHVELHRITHLYRESDPAVLKKRLEGMQRLWLGGTRIADSLATFNREHAARLLNGRTVVLVLSDGFDSDSPELLAEELTLIRSRCRRLLWLNPLLGRDPDGPLDQDMARVAPLVDHLSPAHSLDSLARVADYLARC